MSDSGYDADERGPGMGRVALWLAIFLVGFGLFAFVASRHCRGRGLMATLTFVECAAMAAVAAMFAVNSDPRRVGVRGFVVRLVFVCALTQILASGVLIVAWWQWDAAPLAGGLAAQLVILAFCVVLGSVFSFVRCSGSELLFAQLVTIFVACAMMGTVFYADPIVEAQKSPEARSMVIRGILATNPLTAISWSLLEFDLMRRQLMYDRISVIGGSYGEPGHNVSYPTWWGTAGAYVIVAFVLFVGGAILRRHRIMRLRRSAGG